MFERPIRYVSYYSTKTIYERLVKTFLIPCLNKFNLPYHIFGMNDLGSWKENVLLQPSIILTAMKTFPNDDIVWLDADTSITSFPELFYRIPPRSDVGFYALEMSDHYGEIMAGQAEILTNVLFFRNSPKTIDLVSRWEQASLNPNKNHRTEFASMMTEDIEHDLSVFLLPRHYSYISLRTDGSVPLKPLFNPVIIQHGASSLAKTNLYDQE